MEMSYWGAALVFLISMSRRGDKGREERMRSLFFIFFEGVASFLTAVLGRMGTLRHPTSTVFAGLLKLQKMQRFLPCLGVLKVILLCTYYCSTNQSKEVPQFDSLFAWRRFSLTKNALPFVPCYLFFSYALKLS